MIHKTLLTTPVLALGIALGSSAFASTPGTISSAKVINATDTLCQGSPVSGTLHDCKKTPGTGVSIQACSTRPDDYSKCLGTTVAVGSTGLATIWADSAGNNPSAIAITAPYGPQGVGSNTLGNITPNASYYAVSYKDPNDPNHYTGVGLVPQMPPSK